MIDVFHLCMGLGPVACYLVLLGAINLRNRPCVVSGGSDTTALGLAVSGMIFFGPLALLFPQSAANSLGAHGHKFMWAMLATAYGLSFVLVLLYLRPRIVIYNITGEMLRPLLADVALRLDGGSRWAGDCLALPALGVQLHLENSPWMRNMSLVSAGPKQDFQGWLRLRKELTAALREKESPRNSWGLVLTCMGTILFVCLAWDIAREPQAFVQTARDLWK
jgi:hypothetical protein